MCKVEVRFIQFSASPSRKKKKSDLLNKTTVFL